MMSESQRNSEPQSSNLEPRVVQQKNNVSLKVAGAAIFSALSYVVAFFTTKYIPRVPGWQIAYFDPISIIWMMAFLIFGFEAGLLTYAIGFVILMVFDPSAPIGPVMKIAATIWFVLFPYLYTKLKSKQPFSQENLKQLKYFIPSVLIGLIFRIIFMMAANFIILLYIFNIPLEYMSLSWIGLPNINAVPAVIVTVILINTIQTIFDTLVPYLVVFKTNLTKMTPGY
jgi:riboflavin transporter FmnP